MIAREIYDMLTEGRIHVQSGYVFPSSITCILSIFFSSDGTEWKQVQNLPIPIKIARLKSYRILSHDEMGVVVVNDIKSFSFTFVHISHFLNSVFIYIPLYTVAFLLLLLYAYIYIYFVSKKDLFVLWDMKSSCQILCKVYFHIRFSRIWTCVFLFRNKENIVQGKNHVFIYLF